METSSSELDHLVRAALAHLYDYAYLQNHPLAAMVEAGETLDQITRAQLLRRLLLDCIEALRPLGQESVPSDASRAYAILTYRYIDGITMEEIAEKRGLSERQAYRELEKGVEAVARLLLDRMSRRPVTAPTTPPLPPENSGDHLQMAQVEVARLGQAVESESLDLGEVLRGVLELIDPISKRRGVQVMRELPEGPTTVLANRVMLRQALLSLLTRTLDSLAPGKIKIAISLTRNHVKMQLDATLGGEREQPIDATAQAHYRLSVAQALLVAQGGRLEAEEQEGRWHVEVLLPATDRLTILVVDDNADLVALLQRYLAGHEVYVVGVTDGRQALRLASELQPQMITLDVMMPNQDGWEILQQLKASPSTADIPVVICSVLHEPELAQTMGASDYITKPVRQADLIEVLRRRLGLLLPAA